MKLVQSKLHCKKSSLQNIKKCRLKQSKFIAINTRKVRSKQSQSKEKCKQIQYTRKSHSKQNTQEKFVQSNKRT